MGAIFAAEHMATEERVALKVLWPHVLGSKTAVESFQLEGRITARLGSENIVRVLDAGFDDALGVPFLSMELLRGVTLRALVGKAGALAPAEALFVLRQAASALDKAHAYADRAGRASPIVHRDLKPENLFIALRDRADVVVKVLDFGLAKVLSESHAHSREVKGTPLFMAREQFSHGPVTPQIDIWALGLIAFYVLAGRIYWLSGTQDSGGVASLLNEILVLPTVSPTERASALGLPAPWPAEFDGWFLRCLEHDPQNRFASAGEAVSLLGEIFASGAGLAEASIAKAGPALTQKVVDALGRSQEEGDGAATAMSSRASVTRVVAGEATERVSPGDPPGSATASSGATMGVASALPTVPSRRTFRRWLGATALGGAACVALSAALFQRRADTGFDATTGPTGGPALPTAPSGGEPKAAPSSLSPPIEAAPAGASLSPASQAVATPGPPAASAAPGSARAHSPPPLRPAAPPRSQGASEGRPPAPAAARGAKGEGQGGEGRQEEARPAPPSPPPVKDIYSEP